MNCDACGKPNARVTRGLKNKRRVLCANCKEAVKSVEHKIRELHKEFVKVRGKA